MRYFGLFFILILFSCHKKEQILLPKSSNSVVTNVEDLSAVYIFFKVSGGDTLADVNRNNTIRSTNWVFNIDKRLPLNRVIPEIIKLQEKRRSASIHQNELAQNYFSYADTIGKNLAFLPFTNVYYKMEKPIGMVIYFNKNNEILIENNIIKKEKLKELINETLPENISNKFIFRFNIDLDYGSYIQDKIFIHSLNVKMNSNEEYVY